MGIASMTKPVIAAVTLKLNEAGVFGPEGLDTPVDRLLTPAQITDLTVGDDPANPRCPGFTFLFDREKWVFEGTFSFEWEHFSCPDLSQVTLRQLMTANHGMYDYWNEVLLPNGRSQYEDGFLSELFDFFGARRAASTLVVRDHEIARVGSRAVLSADAGSRLVDAAAQLRTAITGSLDRATA